MPPRVTSDWSRSQLLTASEIYLHFLPHRSWLPPRPFSSRARTYAAVASFHTRKERRDTSLVRVVPTRVALPQRPLLFGSLQIKSSCHALHFPLCNDVVFSCVLLECTGGQQPVKVPRKVVLLRRRRAPRVQSRVRGGEAARRAGGGRRERDGDAGAYGGKRGKGAGRGKGCLYWWECWLSVE